MHLKCKSELRALLVAGRAIMRSLSSMNVGVRLCIEERAERLSTIFSKLCQFFSSCVSLHVCRQSSKKLTTHVI